MVEVCPFCTGKLVEKHDEIIGKGTEARVVIHFRCLSCGKWAKKKQSQWDV
ncbi:MAG: hypothetical protein KAR33_09850 [Candidatus Thorarchaeota archaeon]|nr:hypothetical protein [Candidatus Thorarchaeota archaeon]